MKEINNIGVVGAGAWGTTLGLLALSAGSKAIVWSYESDIADEINTSHTKQWGYIPLHKFISLKETISIFIGGWSF